MSSCTQANMTLDERYEQAKEYALRQAESLNRLELMEFFTSVHDQVYPEIDVTFMEYFLEIAKCGRQFIVHHSKLHEYGVMTSTESGDVKKKMDSLGLREGVDYLLGDISERDFQHGGSNKKVYHLTPRTFKKCLMRAKRNRGQPVDPVIYSDYYLFLEEVFGLYRDYQSAYQEKVISMKDDKIDTLIKEVTEQNSKITDQTSVIRKQSSMIDEMSAKMNKLMGFAEDTNIQLADTNTQLVAVRSDLQDMNSKFDNLFDFTSTFARTTLSTWIGSLVFKSQLDQLIKDKDLAYALKHLKVMFTVAFYRVVGDETEFAIYFCCTNFADLNKRIRELYNRHSVEGMLMLKPEAICLISQEINCERAKLQQLVQPTQGVPS